MDKKDPTKAQFSTDARLMSEFEQSGVSGELFDYAKSVTHAPQTRSTDDEINAYLSKIQRGSLVQSFGCTITIQKTNFNIISYSENCFHMLGIKNGVEMTTLIGVDARTLFSPSSRTCLQKAVELRDLSFINPIWVHAVNNHKSFYAILHRIDVGIVIDLEPTRSGDPEIVHAGAVQSQKLAVRAISRLQSLPGGDIGVLCDTVVEDVQKLTGYDRVMVYKFHDDNHGEVLSEIRRSDLNPYLGLHYPATDIPQAARHLFMQSRVRMICNCNALPVKIVQSEELKKPLCLIASTLRSPHECHIQYMRNMGSTASLAMAVIVNEGNSRKLWGLVVCHHTSPRCVSFPLRHACEFLMQAFALQLNMEVQLAARVVEKKIISMQTLLCDMLLRNSPLSMVTQSPNMMDLVRCDGAALYNNGESWQLGVTPNEAQLRDIVDWMVSSHGNCTGISTECLAEAGYHGAALLGDEVCGMASARISSNYFLFWFRSHKMKEIKWGGAKHHPEDKDDGSKMNPRSSFKVFLEVVKGRSLPWETAEINAIHSLQLIMRDSFGEIESRMEIEAVDGHDDSEVDELASAAVEMVRLIETASAPIFGVDSSGLINGWNAKMSELTGLEMREALGKSLVNDVVHGDSREVVETLLATALQGNEEKNVEVKLFKFGTHSPNSVVYLTTNACATRDHQNAVIGVCFVCQDITAEKTVLDKFIRLKGDYKAITQNLNPLIPPIFASDENACCSEWNAVMENLTGWTRHDVIGKLLAGEIFGNLCQLKGEDVLTKFMILLYRAISGHDTENIPFGFYDRKGEFVEVCLTANKREDENGNVIGCLCLLSTVINNDKEFVVDERLEIEHVSKLKELAYIRHELKNPLQGIRFTHQLLQVSTLTNDQKEYLETSDACERQMLCIINDVDFGSLENGKMELREEDCTLGNVVNSVISQAMILLKEKNLRLIRDMPDQTKTLCVYGDQIKLQLALSDFLICIVNYAPPQNGWVELKVSHALKLIQDGSQSVHLQFRMSHPGQGIPYELFEDMYGVTTHRTRQEGITLNIAQKLVSMMNGTVRYNRDQDKCYFLIDLELKSKNQDNIDRSGLQ